MNKQENSKPNNSFKNNLHTNNKTKQEIDYFIAGPGTEANRVASAEITQKMHDDVSDIFTGNGCFKGTFSLQVKYDTKPYKALLRHIEYTLQEPFQKS